MAWTMIFVLLTAHLISCVICHEVYEDVEEYGPNMNVTTLYPVQNISLFTKEKCHTNYDMTNNYQRDDSVPRNENKPNTKFNEKENKELTEESSKEMTKTIPDDLTKSKDGMTIASDVNKTNSNKDDNVKMKNKEPKRYMSNWNIDTGFTPPKFDRNEITFDDNKNESNNKTSREKEFKPSPELSYFYDEDSSIIPTQPSIGSFIPFSKTPSFISSPKDLYKLNYKPPSFGFRDESNAPYKFENTMFPRTKDWSFNSAIEPTPTVEAPVKIPAGGLYKHPDAFKEKPGTDGDDDDFGLEFKDGDKDVKENSIKKRNPWKNFLNLVTALVPVGIIMSALTPRIITLESTANSPHFPSRFSRRSDSVVELPEISENCKRRLLCEIYSDTNYTRRTSFPQRQKHCYKLQCDDPQALNKVLHWLLLYHRARDRPRPHDRRGYIT